MLKNLLLIALLFLGGIYSFAQSPANDSCHNAIEVMLDMEVEFSTIGATQNGPDHEGCFGTTNDSIPADVWFVFNSPITGEVEWSLCGTADYDSRIAVYQAGASCLPTDDDILECNDDGPDCADNTSILNFVVNEGETYLLRIGGYGDDTGIPTEGSGTFTIVELTGGPENNLCANAIPVFLGTGQEFTTVDATTDGPDHPDNPCFGFNSLTADNDIWFLFTPDYTGFAEWSTCNTPLTNYINFDSRMAVYNPGSACPPLDEDLLACNDDGPECENFTSYLVFPVTEGETYLLRLGGYSGDSGSGIFDLSSIIPADPPENDDCSNSIAVDIITPEMADDFEGVTEGTTNAATFVTDDFIFPNCVGTPQGEFSDVWYDVNTLGNDSLEIRFYSLDDNEGAAFYFDVLASCTDTINSGEIMNSCLYVTQLDGTASTMITGLPSGEDINLKLRVTTHITFDVTGNFGFQVVGDVVNSNNDLTIAEEMTFFPNPVSENGNLEFQLKEDMDLQINIFNMLGQKVQQRNLGALNQGNHNIPVDVSQLEKGIYMLQVTDGKLRQNLKILIQ